MKVVRESQDIKMPFKAVVLTMGNFDGVHLGHQRIFKEVADRALRVNGTSVVYTYDPHPVKVVAPNAAPSLIQTEAQKLSLIESYGIDICIVEKFTPEFAKLTAKEFFDEVVLERLAPKCIIVGYDFTFGIHRSGTVEMLERLAPKNNIELVVVEAMFLEETLLSSTQVRTYISRGRIEEANAMLGRPCSLVGKVVKGRGIGGKIGFHTANIEIENELIPLTGVYVTKTLGKRSVTNIGYNPTFGGTNLTVETHILDFSGDLCGRQLEVEFYKRLRAEKVFKNVEDLRHQIECDVKEARAYEKI